MDRQAAPPPAPAAVEGSVAGPLVSLEAVIDVCRGQGLDVEDGVGVERILRKLAQGRTASKVHNLRLACNLDAHPVGDLVAEVAALVGVASAAPAACAELGERGVVASSALTAFAPADEAAGQLVVKADKGGASKSENVCLSRLAAGPHVDRDLVVVSAVQGMAQPDHGVSAAVTGSTSMGDEVFCGFLKSSGAIASAEAGAGKPGIHADNGAVGQSFGLSLQVAEPHIYREPFVVAAGQKETRPDLEDCTPALGSAGRGSEDSCRLIEVSVLAGQSPGRGGEFAAAATLQAGDVGVVQEAARAYLPVIGAVLTRGSRTTGAEWAQAVLPILDAALPGTWWPRALWIQRHNLMTKASSATLQPSELAALGEMLQWAIAEAS